MMFAMARDNNLPFSRQLSKVDPVRKTPTPFKWYLQWGGVLFVGAVIVSGVVLYRPRIRHRTGVLAEHAVAVPVPQGAPAPREEDFEPQRVS